MKAIIKPMSPPNFPSSFRPCELLSRRWGKSSKNQESAGSYASSSARVADPLQAMAIEDEDGITNDSNVFASLMPNLFSRLQHCNETVSEQEFQEIHRLLNLARSDDDLIKGNASMNQPSIPFSKQREKDNGLTQEEVKKRPSPPIKSDCASGKENAELPQRNKLSRRERSSRVTTHRKPFVVDIRKFGSILNSNALGKCKKPQDVHAFWEAADEREASEAIMSKLRGRIEQKPGNGDTTLRRVGVRRKNSQRTTTRLRRFAVELPACGEQVQSLDEEQLEEEDATQESSFTFLSNPEFRAHSHLFESSNAEKYIKASQLASSIQSAEKYVEIVDLDGAAKLSCHEEDDNDILSDGKSPLVNSKGTGQCCIGLKDIAASKDGSDECEKPSQVPDILSDAPSHQAVDPIISLAADSQNKNLAEVIDTGDELEMKATPYNRNVAAKRTPFTSPTPPSNPLAAFGLRKDNVVEDISNKRRLDFDDNNMNSTTLELDSPAPIMQIAPVLQNPSASPEVSQAQVEVYSQDISKRRLDFDNKDMNSTTLEFNLSAPITQISPVVQNPSASPEVPQAQVEVTSPANAMLMHEENVELAEEVNTKAPDVAEINTKTPDVVPTVATKNPEQNAKKPLKKAIAKRKKPMNNRRDSLTGAGTYWNEGQRRSTRIRSRPLEWWRGERFLVGRVHKSLATVIGIKYSSPPPCWPKRGTQAPKFKVESYVSEEYAKYVEFAAMY